MFKTLESIIEEKKFSGVITIQKKNKIIYNRAFGYLDRANKVRNDINTSFGIASGTKLFTALGVLKLVESKQLSLDSKLFDIIERPFASYDPNVTIKQLLSHTSGLPDYYDEDLIDDFDNFKVSVPWHELLKPSDYMAVMPDRPMKFSPGENFHYNNGAFVFLAMVIESLSGDYHQWIEEEIIKPNSLNKTGFYKLNQLPENTAHGYIDMADSWRTNIYSLPIIAGGDGGIFTSSDDLITLWKQLLDYKILSEDLTEILLTPHAETNEEGHYGLGIWLDQKKDIYNPSIVGADAGVSFISTHKIKEKLTINILSNTSEGAWEVNPSIQELLKKI
ncbi:MAG: serine hydrolase [Clostridiales bacterium]|nr:serine hydrolase [Clostridiales bacterium]